MEGNKKRKLEEECSQGPPPKKPPHGSGHKRKLDEESSQGPPPKKPTHGSGHKLSQRHSKVSSDWDTHLGPGNDHFSPLHLPIVRAVLQRYRYLRTENPTDKKINIASVIAHEVISLWDKAWIPHHEFRATQKAVLKEIDAWIKSSHRPESRGKAEFQDSLNQLFDIRPVSLRSMEALEKHLKSSRNEDWQSDLTFFKGQMKVSLIMNK